jgi:dipeptidyl aminopeptidase/acylaminoacyl peptidase
VGDPRTEAGKQALLEVSPLTHVSRIQRPLLIGQGANDPRVKKQESDQIVAAMQAKEIPVSYVVFPDEGHGFARSENTVAFIAVVEAFLSVHLGGWFEPLTRAELEASSLTVEAGQDELPGLPD